MQSSIDSIRNAPVRLRGNTFDDFHEGQVFDHHWGRTLTEADATLFATTTLQANPAYFNAEYARRRGHAAMLLPPMLVFAVVFGLSVEDLSERGGAFLGVEDLSFAKPVHAGDTLTARSTVAGLRPSRSDPDYGIATWHTEGFDQHGERVIAFRRSNLVIRRAAAG